MSIVEVPRTLILNNVQFTEEEIKNLKELYKDLDMAIFLKSEVRKRDSVLQKALLSGAVVNLSIEFGDSVTLNLTQQGRMLLGKV